MWIYPNLRGNLPIFLKKIFNNGHDFVAPSGAQTQPPEHEQKIIEQKMQTIFSQAAVKSAIIGTLNPAHLKMNVKCAAKILN